MADSDVQPLVQSPRWGSVPPAKREELLGLWRDPGTSDSDRQAMLTFMQTPGAPPASEGPSAPVEPAVSPMTPSPWEALKGAFTGTQRLPGQAGAPPEGVNIADVATARLRESPFGQVVGPVVESMTQPSSIGEVTGTLLVPGPLKPVAGAFGAGAGEAVRQVTAGEPFDVKKIGTEVGLSALPEVVESAGRGIMRQFARNSPGGQRLRFEQAASEARAMPEAVFQPQPAAQISQAFDRVRAAKVDVDVGDLSSHLSTLSPGKQADILNTLNAIDRTHKTGGRYVQLYTEIMQGTAGARDLGALQTMRSHLRQEADMLADKSSEAYQLIKNFQRAIDDTIDHGLVSNATAAKAQGMRDLLHQARKDYAHRMAADDLGDLIESKITSSADLKSNTIQIKALYDDLRRGKSQASQSINRALDLTPGARDRFEREVHDIARLYEKIELPMTDVAGISRMPVVAAIRQGVGQMLLTDWGRKWLRNAVIEGRGTLSPNAVALLVNAGRREYMPELTGRPRESRSTQVESWLAPGGPARSTD